MQKGMQKYGKFLIFCSSFVVLFLMNISVNNNYVNNVLAQPLSDSSIVSGHFPSTSKDDLQLIEDIINRQGRIIKEPEVPIITDSSEDDSGGIAPSGNRNGEIEDSENENEYNEDNEHVNSLSGKDDYGDANRPEENSLVDNRKGGQSSSISGEVYVVDYMNIRIQKFDSNGDFITKWGSEGEGDGEFGVPHGIAVHPSSGNVYVVDMNNCNVQIFDSEGNFLSKWGSQGEGDGQFLHPHSIALDSEGNVYVTDMANYNVQKFDGKGNFLLKWGEEGTGDVQFKAPEGLAIDSSDNVYVADTETANIQKFDSEGNLLLKWGSEGSQEGRMEETSWD